MGSLEYPRPYSEASQDHLCVLHDLGNNANTTFLHFATIHFSSVNPGGGGGEEAGGGDSQDTPNFTDISLKLKLTRAFKFEE